MLTRLLMDKQRIGAQVWDQVFDQVSDQVWHQVEDQVWHQVWRLAYWPLKEYINNAD